MRIFHAVAAVQLLAARLVAAAPLDSTSFLDINIDPAAEPLEALAQLQQHAYNTLEQRDRASKRDSNGCSLATAAERKDW
jgi:tyrosinase